MSFSEVVLPYGSSVPSSWNVAPLKYLARLTNGFVFNSADRAESGVPIIRIENLNGSPVFNHSGVSVPSRYRVEQGDLLFAWSGNPGTSFGPYLWSESGFYYLNQHIFKVDVLGCDPRWLYWSLRAATPWIETDLVSGVIGMVHVTKDDLAGVPIPVPPLEEQRRIADFLDAENARIDRMRTAVERLQEVLEERRAVQRSLTLRGIKNVGQRITHPVLGDLPADWELLPLKRLVPRIGVGVVVDPSSYFAEEGVPFLHGSNITENGLDLSGVRLLSEEDSATLWRSRLNTGDVVVVRAGYPGRAVVIPESLDGANCASLLVIKRGERLLPEYLEAYFNSPLGAAYVDSARYGAAQEVINVSHVVNFTVPVPNLGEQKEILAELGRNERPVRELTAKLSQQARLLSERRQALITAAVTGEFDVCAASGRGIEE